MRVQLTSKYQRSIELFSFFSAANDDAFVIRMTYSAVFIVALLSMDSHFKCKVFSITSLTSYCRLVMINYVLFIRFGHYLLITIEIYILTAYLKRCHLAERFLDESFFQLKARMK